MDYHNYRRHHCHHCHHCRHCHWHCKDSVVTCLVFIVIISVLIFLIFLEPINMTIIIITVLINSGAGPPPDWGGWSHSNVCIICIRLLLPIRPVCKSWKLKMRSLVLCVDSIYKLMLQNMFCPKMSLSNVTGPPNFNHPFITPKIKVL